MGKVREAIDAGAGAGYIGNLERCQYLASQLDALSERIGETGEQPRHWHEEIWNEIKTLKQRMEEIESDYDEQCKVLGERSTAAAKNASNANFWTDKYLEATNELARLKQELAEAQTDARRAKNRFLNAAWDSGHYERTIAALKQELAGAQELLKAERTHNYWDQWREAVHSRESMQRDMQQQIDDARADAAQARKSLRAADTFRKERDTLREKLNTIERLVVNFWSGTDMIGWLRARAKKFRAELDSGSAAFNTLRADILEVLRA